MVKFEEPEAAVQRLESQIDELRRELGQIRGDNGLAGPFNGDIDMGGYRVTNAAQSNAESDYVTRDELTEYVIGSSVIIQSFTGAGTSYALSPKAATTNSVVAFVNGVGMVAGGTGNTGFSVDADRGGITTIRSMGSGDYLLVLYIREGAL